MYWRMLGQDVNCSLQGLFLRNACHKVMYNLTSKLYTQSVLFSVVVLLIISALLHMQWQNLFWLPQYIRSKPKDYTWTMRKMIIWPIKKRKKEKKVTFWEHAVGIRCCLFREDTWSHHLVLMLKHITYVTRMHSWLVQGMILSTYIIALCYNRFRSRCLRLWTA